jgi:YD repeat-containing protein
VNDEGQIVRQTDAIGRSREDVYDAAGNIVFSSIAGKGPPCVTTWNEATSTEITTCAGHETVVVCNLFDKAVRVADAGGRMSSFEYDDRGHLVRSMDPDGAEMKLEYSERGFISRVETQTGCEIRIDEQDHDARRRLLWGYRHDCY